MLTTLLVVRRQERRGGADRDQRRPHQPRHRHRHPRPFRVRDRSARRRAAKRATQRAASILRGDGNLPAATVGLSQRQQRHARRDHRWRGRCVPTHTLPPSPPLLPWIDRSMDKPNPESSRGAHNYPSPNAALTRSQAAANRCPKPSLPPRAFPSPICMLLPPFVITRWGGIILDHRCWLPSSKPYPYSLTLTLTRRWHLDHCRCPRRLLLPEEEEEERRAQQPDAYARSVNLEAQVRRGSRQHLNFCRSRSSVVVRSSGTGPLLPPLKFYLARHAHA